MPVAGQEYGQGCYSHAKVHSHMTQNNSAYFRRTPCVLLRVTYYTTVQAVNQSGENMRFPQKHLVELDSMLILLPYKAGNQTLLHPRCYTKPPLIRPVQRSVRLFPLLGASSDSTYGTWPESPMNKHMNAGVVPLFF